MYVYAEIPTKLFDVLRNVYNAHLHSHLTYGTVGKLLLLF